MQVIQVIHLGMYFSVSLRDHLSLFSMNTDSNPKVYYKKLSHPPNQTDRQVTMTKQKTYTLCKHRETYSSSLLWQFSFLSHVMIDSFRCNTSKLYLRVDDC